MAVSLEKPQCVCVAFNQGCVVQMVCLSEGSGLIEGGSVASDVWGKLLSTPSRLLRHTGHVSCCGDGKTHEEQNKLGSDSNSTPITLHTNLM
jgi:hypothetical protein